MSVRPLKERNATALRRLAQRGPENVPPAEDVPEERGLPGNARADGNGGPSVHAVRPDNFPGNERADGNGSPPDAAADAADCRILDLIQTNFPLASRPYAVIGERCGMGEEEAFRRVRALRERGLIRRIGAVFDSGRLGYSGALCAAKVPPDRLRAFTDEVNAHAGVTHNYLRRHAYNVWFTCTAPSPEALRDLTDGIARGTGVAVVSFPAERTYKIKVDFRMGRDDAP
jgi:DNA-binding Lrp family transcriptional regulator